MKVLFFDFNLPHLIANRSYPVGGATVQLYSWIQGFKANDVEVGLLTFKGAKNLIRDDSNLEIFETYDLQVGMRFLKWIYYRYPATFKKIRQSKADVVIKATPELATGMIAFACTWLRIPFVYRVANDIESDERIKLRKTRYEIIAFNYALRTATAIICQNQYQFNKFKKLYPAKPIITIHNPYLDSFSEAKLKKERFYVAWVGIFQTQKNLPGLYEVVSALPNFSFKIAGKQYKLLDRQSQDALEKLEKCKNVEFVGFLKSDEISEFLSHAYLLLNTSHYEGFSNTYLESFAAGTPVVTTRKVDPDGIIYKNGLGQSVESYEEIKSAIEEVIGNPNYDTLSERCKKYIKEHHDPVELSKHYIDFLKINLGI